MDPGTRPDPHAAGCDNGAHERHSDRRRKRPPGPAAGAPVMGPADGRGAGEGGGAGDRPDDALSRISAATLAYYDGNADAFWRGTRDHDVSQNIAALLSHIEGSPPFTLLDLGCGPGRDLKALADLGHRPVGLDGAARFVAMAAAYSGCPVWHQDFVRLDLPDGRFDGIFANAALFHVPAAALPRVLAELHAALKPGGVLFASNPHGQDEEGWRGGRFGRFHHPVTWQGYGTRAGFVELVRYYRPAGLPREQQPWLATVWRKVGEP